MAVRKEDGYGMHALPKNGQGHQHTGTHSGPAMVSPCPGMLGM